MNEPSSIKLTMEEVQQWLGEAQLQIKLRDRAIDQLTEEVKRLQATLTQNQNGSLNQKAPDTK